MFCKEFIKNFCGRIKSDRAKFAREAAEKSDNQYKFIYAADEGNDGDIDRYRQYFKELRNRDKEKRKGVFYKLTNVTPITYMVIPPTFPPFIQKAAEEYFFKLPPSDFDTMIECSEEESSTIKFIRRLRTANLKLYKYEKKNGIEEFFLNYWPILFFFSIEFVILFVFTFAQNTHWLVPCLGIFTAVILLWLLKWARIKKELGLKFFCPFTISFICMYFAKSQEE